MLTIGWAIFSLDTYAKTLSNDIMNQDSGFVIGYILGMFLTTFSPLGAVIAYHGYTKRRENKKEIELK